MKQNFFSIYFNTVRTHTYISFIILFLDVLISKYRTLVFWNMYKCFLCTHCLIWKTKKRRNKTIFAFISKKMEMICLHALARWIAINFVVVCCFVEFREAIDEKIVFFIIITTDNCGINNSVGKINCILLNNRRSEIEPDDEKKKKK